MNNPVLLGRLMTWLLMVVYTMVHHNLMTFLFQRNLFDCSFILSILKNPKIPFSSKQEEFSLLMASDLNAKRLLWFVFTGSRGGLNRLKIISKLKENPLNINQLAKELSLDYKAIQHHIKVLEKNNLITKMGEKYGIMYFISTFLEVNMETFEKIEGKLAKSK